MSLDSEPVDRQQRERLANLEINVGRGVAAYVSQHGGQLYVCGVPSGAGRLARRWFSLRDGVVAAAPASVVGPAGPA